MRSTLHDDLICRLRDEEVVGVRADMMWRDGDMYETRRGAQLPECWS